MSTRVIPWWLCVLGCLASLLGLSPSGLPLALAQSCTHYASPGGGGNGSSQSSPFQIANFWSVAGPGKTLCLLDGTYTGGNSMITPPGGLSGASGNPITIQALNDGQVFLDGQFAREPIVLTNSQQWFVIQGMNAAHGSCDVVEVGPSANNNIIRRVVGWDAAGSSCVGNCHVFDMWENSNNLFEDVAAWGCGRKMFARIYDTNGTFRRCFGIKFLNVSDGSGDAIQNLYKSSNAITENCIAAIDYVPGNPVTDPNVFKSGHYCDTPSTCTSDGSYCCHNDWGSRGDVTITLKGNMSYITDQQDGSGLLSLIQSTMNPGNLAGGMTANIVSADNLAMRRNNAFPGTGIDFSTPFPGSCVTSFSQSSGVNGTTCDHIGPYTDSVGAVASATNSTEAGNKGTSQFAGGGLLQTAATSRPAFGAWLKNQYVNGTLTNTPLWPWPMNQRIKDAMVQSGYASKGGLDGKGATDLQQLIFSLAGESGAPPPPTGTPTYHVAQNGGSDSNSCSAAQNVNSAKATIGAGVSCLSGGNTLIIHAGTYAEFVNGTIPSGSSGSPTIVKGNGNPAQGTGERAVIKPPGVGGYTSVMKITGHDIVIDGLVLDGSNNKNVVIGIDTTGGIVQNNEIMGMGAIPNDGNGAACVDLFQGQGGGSNTVRNNLVHDCTNPGDDPNGLATHCFYVHSSNNLIDGNIAFNCSNHCVQQFNGSGNTNSNVIRNNTFHDCAARGILLSSGNDNQAYNNIVYNSGFAKPGGGRGAIATTDGNNNQLYNNTVYNNLVGIRVGPNGPTNTVLRNNIAYNNQSDTDFSGNSGMIDDHNMYGVNPLFVNTGAGDFHLQSGSPAIDTGVSVSNVFTTDRDGNARPFPSGGAWDKGAYEFGGTPPVQPPASQVFDPLVWLPLNEGAGTTAADISGNNHPGTLVGNATWAPGVRSPSAVQCNGTSGTGVVVSGLLGTPPTLTIALWANIPTITAGQPGGEIFSMGDYVALRIDSSILHAFYQIAGNGFDGTDYPTTALVGTGWHHYVYVVNPAQGYQRLYIDNVLVLSTTYTDPIAWTGLGSDTKLCTYTSSPGYYLTGTIDQVKVSQHAWTPLEVGTDYLGVNRLIPSQTSMFFLGHQ